MKIAFIGIGNMGEPMAINLLKANHTIFVYDIVRKKINRVEKEGCVYKAVSYTHLTLPTKA